MIIQDTEVTNVSAAQCALAVRKEERKEIESLEHTSACFDFNCDEVIDPLASKQRTEINQRDCF